MKGTGGFYYVNDGAGHTHECKACGRFRKEKITPLIGDYVAFECQQGLSYGFIGEILPRRNCLVRPAVANVDKMIVVLSAGKPYADTALCDKLLLQAGKSGIEAMVCINKVETGREEAKELEAQYAAYGALCISVYDGTGIERLREQIQGKCVCFAGQSAVGKSSIINVLEGTNRRETGGLSRKTDRGKHTTRMAELTYLRPLDAYVVDTPGFSMLDAGTLKKEDVARYYREFIPYQNQCRFATCLHAHEPDCAVKQAVQEGKVNRKRYERYLKIINDLGEKQ